MKNFKFNVFIVAIFSILLFSCCSNNKYDYQEYGLNRAVKSVKVTTYEAESKFGEIVKEDITREGTYLAEFNSVGNLSAITGFYSNGDIECKMTYEYNDKNLLVEKFEYGYNGELSSRTTYQYNEDALLSEMTEYDSDGNIDSRLTFEHDGEYVTKSTYTSNYQDGDSFIHITEIKRNGSQILEQSSITNGKLTSKEIFTNSGKFDYDYVRYDAEGNEKGTGHEEYDKNGNLIKYEFTSTTDENKNRLSIITYNKNGLPVYLKGARLEFYKYNDFTDYPELSDSSDIFYIDYEYDKEGNWIKRIIYKGEQKEPFTISERSIVYR